MFVFRAVGLPNEQITVVTNGFLVDGRQLSNSMLPGVLRNRNWLPDSGLSTNRSWKLGLKQIFVVGDNLQNANDRRYWGPLDVTNVIGVVNLRR